MCTAEEQQAAPWRLSKQKAVLKRWLRLALQEQEMSDIEKQFKAERGGGNYGVGTKEKQQANYVARKEAEERRRELFDQALAKFKAGDIEGVRTPPCLPPPTAWSSVAPTVGSADRDACTELCRIRTASTSARCSSRQR